MDIATNVRDNELGVPDTEPMLLTVANIAPISINVVDTMTAMVTITATDVDTQ